MIDSIKHFIDAYSAPSWSFTIFAVGFIWALFQRWIWTKQMTVLVLVIITLGGWLALQDHNFRVTLLKPDNAPIFLMVYLFGFFLWVAMTQAHNNDRRMEQKLPPAEKETGDQKTWVWPDLVYIEFLCMILCTVGLVVWSLVVAAPLEEPANPATTPNPSKAPWYFLGLQELLVYFDPWYAGVVLPSTIVLGLMAIPYLDRNPKGNGYFCFRDRRFAIVTFLFCFMVLWNFLIPIGTVLRGPGWNFFGPFEKWSPHKVVALTNVNLSEYVWVKWFYPLGKVFGWDWLSQGLPSFDTSLTFSNLGQILKKEFAGFLFLGWWFLYLPGRAARGSLPHFYDHWGIGRITIAGLLRPVSKTLSFAKELYESLGFARYSVMILLFLTMVLVPMKMYLRWLVNLKYIVDTPWIKF